MLSSVAFRSLGNQRRRRWGRHQLKSCTRCFTMTSRGEEHLPPWSPPPRDKWGVGKRRKRISSSLSLLLFFSGRTSGFIFVFFLKKGQAAILSFPRRSANQTRTQDRRNQRLDSIIIFFRVCLRGALLRMLSDTLFYRFFLFKVFFWTFLSEYLFCVAVGTPTATHQQNEQTYKKRTTENNLKCCKKSTEECTCVWTDPWIPMTSQRFCCCGS